MLPSPARHPVHPRTQLLACEWQEGRILIEVLVEVDAQETQLLLDALDFLMDKDCCESPGEWKEWEVLDSGLPRSCAELRYLKPRPRPPVLASQ